MDNQTPVIENTLADSEPEVETPNQEESEQSQEEMLRQLQLAIVDGLARMPRRERRRMYRKNGNLSTGENLAGFVKRIKEQISLAQQIRNNQVDMMIREYDFERSEAEEKKIRGLIERHGEEKGIAIYEANIDVEDKRSRDLQRRKDRRSESKK